MAQFAPPTLNAAVDDGITLSTKLNGMIPALYSTHSGAAAPPSPAKGQLWMDTSGETAVSPAVPTHVLKQYTGTVWNVVGTMNLTTGAFSVAGGFSSTGGTVTGPILFPSGTAPLPSITFDGDPNTGIYRVAADQIGFSTGGVQRVLLTGTTFDILTGAARVAGNSAVLNLDRAAGTAGLSQVSWRVGTSTRFTAQVTGAESTGNAGSNFFLGMWNDDGSLLVNYLQLFRGTRQMGINGPSFGNGTVTIRTTATGIGEDALELMNTNADLNAWVGMNLRASAGGLRGAIRGVRPGNNNGDVQIHYPLITPSCAWCLTSSARNSLT